MFAFPHVDWRVQICDAWVSEDVLIEQEVDSGVHDENGGAPYFVIFSLRTAVRRVSILVRRTVSFGGWGVSGCDVNF